MEEIKTNWCHSCEKDLDVSNFYKRKASINGLQSTCKKCFKEKYPVKLKYPEYIFIGHETEYLREYNKNWARNCSPAQWAIKAKRHSEYQKKNRVRLREYHREWRKNNPDKIKAYNEKMYEQRKNKKD